MMYIVYFDPWLERSFLHLILTEGRRKKIEETLGYIDQRLGELEQEKEEVFDAACHDDA